MAINFCLDVSLNNMWEWDGLNRGEGGEADGSRACGFSTGAAAHGTQTAAGEPATVGGGVHCVLTEYQLRSKAVLTVVGRGPRCCRPLIGPRMSTATSSSPSVLKQIGYEARVSVAGHRFLNTCKL
jgi:hypothetical protein